MKTSIINEILETVIDEIRIVSFYNNGHLVNDMTLVYIKVNNGIWYSFTTSDGKNILRREEEPTEIEFEVTEGKFVYPIRTVKLGYEGKKIIGIKQYSWRGLSDELCGFYIELDDGSGFSIFEDSSEKRSIINGIKHDENYVLF